MLRRTRNKVNIYIYIHIYIDTIKGEGTRRWKRKHSYTVNKYRSENNASKSKCKAIRPAKQAAEPAKQGVQLKQLKKKKELQNRP